MMIVKDGKYLGDWKDGKKHGIGYEITPDDEYRGQFEEGERAGFGIILRNSEEGQLLVEHTESGEMVQVESINKNLERSAEGLNPEVFMIRKSQIIKSIENRVKR